MSDPTHNHAAEQLTLFGGSRRSQQRPPNVPPPANSTVTSRAAAASIAKHAPTQRERVLAAIISAGIHGATNEELAFSLNMRTQSVTARRNELMKLGMIAKHGERPGTSGRAQEVLIATQKGRETNLD